eukprot:352476-Chlamydomonas_euryale.AAC.23
MAVVAAPPRPYLLACSLVCSLSVGGDARTHGNLCADPAKSHACTSRASIMQLSAKERSNALPLLPRHTMEAIVGAYCEFHATGDKTLFDVLLVLVPDLDQQLFTAAHAAFPDISAEAWNEILQMASQDLPARHKVAHAIIQALANPARKTLRFE